MHPLKKVVLPQWIRYTLIARAGWLGSTGTVEGQGKKTLHLAAHRATLWVLGQDGSARPGVR